MTDVCRIELLGSLRVILSDRVITRFRTQKTGALLAYLAFYCGRAHSREVLIERLWPDADPVLSRHNLRNALSSLRRQLEMPGSHRGRTILADRTSVTLNARSVSTDVAAFESALEAAVKCDAQERLRLLTAAVDAYGGELLPGYYEDWILPQQLRLEEQFVDASLALARMLADDGDTPAAIQCLRRAVSMHPFHETLHLALMHFQGAVGDVIAVERQFEHLDQIVREQFGQPPSQIARRLLTEIRAGRTDTQHRSILNPAHSTPTNMAGHKPQQTHTHVSPKHEPSSLTRLPVTLDGFFGRERELSALESMLDMLDLPVRQSAHASRLITLTGPWGSGKTRLALELAYRASARPVSNVWFVSLSEIRDPSLVARSVRDALDLPQIPGVDPADQIEDWLLAHPGLLILDNFEQLVEGGAEQARHLCSRVPGLVCIVTSRHRLNVHGERNSP